MTNNEQIRKAFETWAKNNGTELYVRDTENLMSLEALSLFKCWQASRQQVIAELDNITIKNMMIHSMLNVEPKKDGCTSVEDLAIASLSAIKTKLGE